MSNGSDYVKALEEERRKIQVFRRELPLCLELVTQAIERCKEQLSGESECSEETCCDVPVLEQFIPLKRDSSDSDSEEHESKKHKNETSVADCNNNDDCNDTICNKSDWLRSVQLWNQTPDPTPQQDPATKFVVSEMKRDGAFNKEKSTVGGVTATAPPLSPSSTAETGGGNKKEEKEGQRKARRCWSPELHRRFVKALQQLGGPHVATPKQIRELMKVDGLTNDEVKSHLQKYRLHTRRPSTSTHNTQTPQFLVVGGIWVPPEYAAMTTTTASSEEIGGAAANKIHAPVAAPPPPPFHEPPASPKQRRQIKPSSQSTNNGGYSKGAAVQPCSRGSSSTHTTTVSPAC